MKGQSLEQQKVELREMVQYIKDTSQDLTPCGSSVLSLLDKVYQLLDQSRLNDAITLSTSLLRLSNEKLNSFPYRQVPLSWRRLYTDSTLLKSISQLIQSVEEEEVSLLQVMRDLDLALIVSGSPGIERSKLVFQLISIAQSRLPSTMTRKEEEEERPKKRAKLEGSKLKPPYLRCSIRNLPSLPDFLLPCNNSDHTRPFIVRGAASEWPAVEKWKDLNYLRMIGGGKGRVVPVEVGNDYTKEGWGQRIIPWDDFLDTMFSSEKEEEEEEESFYLAQHSLLNQFPLLSRDFPIPSLVYSEPPALKDQYSEYRAPQNEDGWIVNAWLGRGGTVSQAHTDPYWNCYIQVVGSKWVWIAPPSCSAHLKTFGGSKEGTTTTTEYMTNTSTIDVTLPSTFTRDYLDQVEPVAEQIVLEAGDVLVMPPGWWHAMKSLETSFSLSIWF